jgi:hypothetical protein
MARKLLLVAVVALAGCNAHNICARHSDCGSGEICSKAGMCEPGGPVSPNDPSDTDGGVAESSVDAGVDSPVDGGM